MSQENIAKSKKSSRLNAKKEDKVEPIVDKSWTHATINIIIHNEERINEPPKVLKDFNIYKNPKQQVVSYLLVDTLKGGEHCKQDQTVSFWDQYKNSYIFGFNVPKEPRDVTRNIASRFINNNSLNIKIRGKRKLIVESLVEQQRLKYDEDDVNNKNKEKKIAEVVQKVALWRKFYTGFYDEFGNYVQKPLETAAQEVGIAKKTLDDYLLQIRNGKKYGFNFNDKANSKIGELRAFVRDQKKREQK